MASTAASLKLGKDRKRNSQGMLPGDHAKDRHKKTLRQQAVGTAAAAVLNARPEVPSQRSRHYSYYELVENKDKKKKLEFQITSNREPPPGFEFVPIGNPELTTACKEISREQDAMIFIVSTTKGPDVGSLSQQIGRVGHHIRQTIVGKARKAVGDSEGSKNKDPDTSGLPEPIPETQEEINEQADKAIRDLFPRIPHTDRQMIIEHSFKKGTTKKGGPLVGLAQDLTLSRRVQLAVLAHIRHTHTRYDKLLKETTYMNARKAVEALCLDILVKWRGDEETGRDQLDEILREVIVISDSEGDSDDSGSDEEDESDNSSVEEVPAEPRRPQHRRDAPPLAHGQPPDGATGQWRHDGEQPYPQWHDGSIATPPRTYEHYDSYAPAYSYAHEVPNSKRARRGFTRYQAALAARWDEARDRVRLQQDEQPLGHGTPVADLPPYSHYELQHQDPRPPPDTASASVFPHDDVQDLPFHRMDLGDHESRGYSLEPASRTPVSSVPASASHWNASGGLPMSNSPFADGQHPPPAAQRLVVRADEARDLLVPSVEPLSPTGGPQAYPPAPMFIRTVTPRQVSRPAEDLTERSPGHFGGHRSPRWDPGEGGRGGRPAPSKRRRVLESESRWYRDSPQREWEDGEWEEYTPHHQREEHPPHREPEQYYRSVHDERSIPPAVHDGEDFHSHRVVRDERQPFFSQPPVQQHTVAYSTTDPDGRFYVEHNAEAARPPVTEGHAAYAPGVWDRPASQGRMTYGAHGYDDFGRSRPPTYGEENRPRMVEHRPQPPPPPPPPPPQEELYYAPGHWEGEEPALYHDQGYDAPPTSRPYEHTHPYPVVGHADMQHAEEEYRYDAAYSTDAPAPTYHDEHLEPTPVFIRQVEPVPYDPRQPHHSERRRKGPGHAKKDRIREKRRSGRQHGRDSPWDESPAPRGYYDREALPQDRLEFGPPHEADPGQPPYMAEQHHPPAPPPAELAYQGHAAPPEPPFDEQFEPPYEQQHGQPARQPVQRRDWY